MAGFGGMRDHGGVLSFMPRLPQALSRLAFRLTFRGRRLLVEIEHRQAHYTLIEGETLDIVHHGAQATIVPEEPLTLPISTATTTGSAAGTAGWADARQTASHPGGSSASRYDRELVSQSPIEQLLAALDGLDVDRAAALLAPDIRMVLADGRRAVGAAEVRSLLSSFIGQVRANLPSHHRAVAPGRHVDRRGPVQLRVARQRSASIAGCVRRASEYGGHFRDARLWRVRADVDRAPRCRRRACESVGAGSLPCKNSS